MVKDGFEKTVQGGFEKVLDKMVHETVITKLKKLMSKSKSSGVVTKDVTNEEA